MIGRPELAFEGRFADAAGRARDHDEIDRIIEAWTGERSHYEAMHLLQRSGVRAGAVLDARDLCSDPHLTARGFVGTASDGTEGRFPGTPFRLSEGRAETRRPGPDLGEDNEDVLCGLLGWSPDEVDPISADRIGTAFDVDQEDAPALASDEALDDFGQALGERDSGGQAENPLGRADVVREERR